MGACLLLAYKFNEPNVAIRTEFSDPDPPETGKKKKKKSKSALSYFSTTKKADSIFASLLNFLATDWNLNPKELFSAEWGVFVALEFKLHASPNQIAFHFKRLMKSLERRPLTYLGTEMYTYWQDVIDNETCRMERKQKRREVSRSEARIEKRGAKRRQRAA